MYKKDKLQKIADALNDEKGELCLSLWEKNGNCEKAKIGDGIINFTFQSIKYSIAFEENEIKLSTEDFEENSFPIFREAYDGVIRIPELVKTSIDLLNKIFEKINIDRGIGFFNTNDDVLNKAIIEYYTKN